jgi:O-antigen ligase
MSALQTETRAPGGGSPVRASLPAAAIAVGIVLAMSAALLVGSQSGLMLVAGVAALVLGLCALARPVLATILLLVTLFMRFPIRSQITLPVELFFVVFAGLLIATALWMDRTPTRLRGIGAVEWAMALYLMWNVYSMLAPHEYPAGNPLSFSSYSVPRSIVVATVIPFGMYVVGRYVFERTSAVRALLWVIMTLAAYAAAVSIMPFVGLSDWVWPRYIVEISKPEQGARSELEWVGRALGIFDQPVANGMVLALCFAIAMLLVSRRDEPTWRRCVAFVIAVACGCGVYLTHTRAAWLGAAAVLIIGAILAKGFRRGFVAALGLVITVVLTNWSTFSSDDRAKGGVASSGEVSARLNVNETALWAAARKPIEGWGIGRFQYVNFHHHQQWSQSVPWIDGYGLVAHENELGILAELGAIGLMAWICVLVLIAHRLWKAYQTLPDHDLCGKPLAVIAIMAMVILVCTGFTVDLRYFDFPTALIFLLAGITAGWSDRNQRANTPLYGDLVKPVLHRHGGRRLDALPREVSR